MAVTWWDRRERWLNRLAAAVEEDGPSQVAAAIWGLVREQLQQDGMGGERASRIALRHAQLAGYLVRRVPQRDAAHRLGVDPRTAARDARRLRDLVQSGALDRHCPR